MQKASKKQWLDRTNIQTKLVCCCCLQVHHSASIRLMFNKHRSAIRSTETEKPSRFGQTNLGSDEQIRGMYLIFITAQLKKIKTLTITYCITLARNADGKHHQSVQEGKHQLMPSEFLRCCKGTMHEAVLAKPKYLAKHQRGNPGGSYDWLLPTKVSAKPAKLLNSRGSNKAETWFKPRVLKFCE